MGKKNTILIAEDQLVGRLVLESMLYTEGYNLVFAVDGREAYDLAVHHQPDLIILDIMMPYQDGFEVTKKIRDNESIRETPILIATALDDRDSKIKGLKVGANDYITKPIDKLEILTKIRSMLHINKNNTSSEAIFSNKEETKNDPSQNTKSVKWPTIINKASRQSQSSVNNINPACIILPEGDVNAGINGFYKIDNKLIFYLGALKEDHADAHYFEGLLSQTLRNCLLSADNLYPNIILNNVISEISSLFEKMKFTFDAKFEIILCVFDPENQKLTYSGTNSSLVIFNAGSWKEFNTINMDIRFDPKQTVLFEIKDYNCKVGDKIAISTNKVMKMLNDFMWFEQTMFLDSVKEIKTIDAYKSILENDSLDQVMLLGFDI